MSALVRLLLLLSAIAMLVSFGGAYQHLVSGELMVVFAAAGVLLGCIAFLFALVGILLKLGAGFSSWLAILYGIVILGAGTYFYVGFYMNLPHLADVSTDTLDPPEFRGKIQFIESEEGQEYVQSKNSRIYDPTDAAIQAAGYPDIKPAIFKGKPPEIVFRAAMLEARSMPDLQISESEPEKLHFEATAESDTFHFVDDIAFDVRVRGDASILNIRSRSRAGLFDFGANATRIRKFLTQINSYIKKAEEREIAKQKEILKKSQQGAAIPAAAATANTATATTAAPTPVVAPTATPPEAQKPAAAPPNPAPAPTTAAPPPAPAAPAANGKPPESALPKAVQNLIRPQADPKE